MAMGTCRSAWLAAALLTCAGPVLAQEVAPLQLAPTSDWVMDYADDNCALRRAFGTGEHRASLQLRQYAPGVSVQVTVASETLPLTRRPPRIRFEPDSESVLPGWMMQGSFGTNAQGVLYNHYLVPLERARQLQAGGEWTDAERDAREMAITGLLVQDAFERDFQLQTGALHAPMNAMRACLDELLTHWGIDAAAQRTLSRRVEPVDLPAWTQRIQRSYPRRMAQQRRSGFVQIRLIVGADGRPTSCSIQAETADPAFETAACKATLRHARFHPALDAAGAPVASFFTTTIAYVV